MNKMGFFEWVAKTRRITDNPRGDFVQDTALVHGSVFLGFSVE